MDVYDVAARPVVKAAMEGVNGMQISARPIGLHVSIACRKSSDPVLRL